MLQLEQTNHAYYCSSSNYYVEGPDHGQESFESWKDFTSEWCHYVDGQLEIDRDYVLCFRYDMHERNNKTFELELFFILQRKGNYVPVSIKEVREEDLPEINQFLSKYKQYLFNLWDEIDTDPAHEIHQTNKEDIMKATGVVRRIDDLGRIVIPRPIRDQLKIQEGTAMEIFIDGEDIIFRKYPIFDGLSTDCEFFKRSVENMSEDLGSEATKEILDHIKSISKIINKVDNKG